MGSRGYCQNAVFVVASNCACVSMGQYSVDMLRRREAMLFNDANVVGMRCMSRRLDTIPRQFGGHHVSVGVRLEAAQQPFLAVDLL